MGLSKSFGTLTLLAAAVAGIVGSGWLLGPLVTAKMAGPAAILTWLIAGILMMVVASTFVFLTRSLPITGGTVRFFQLSHGHFAGFSFSWIAWLAWIAVAPIETMALIQYSSNYIPSLMTTGSSPTLTSTGIVVAISLMIIITFINNYGVRIYSRINTYILAFKLLIPIITVIILMSSHFHTANFTKFGGFIPNGIQSIFSALPLAGVIYAFIGFNPAIQLAGESKNPRKAIPIAVFGALGICIFLYTLIQIAFIAALPVSSIQHGWEHINFAGDHGPFVGLLSRFGLFWIVKLLYFDAAISPFGTAMVQSLATGRLTYAMSKNGYLPRQLMQTNKHHSPKRAMLLNLIIGIVFFLPFPSWQHMVGFLVSCLVLGYVVGPMALMVMVQQRVPGLKKYSPKLLHGVCLLAFYICNLLIYWTGWSIVFKVLILFIAGYFFLWIKTFFTKDSLRIKNFDIVRGSWVVFYMLAMGAISYFGSFGGQHVIPFGWDFIAIGMMTIAIYGLAYFLAVRTTLSNTETDMIASSAPIRC